jgi:flagellar protein FlaJ
MSPETESTPFSRKMEQLHELAERVRILFTPPREYFTIVIPVAVAVLLVVGAFLAGYQIMGTERAQDRVSEKQKAYEELLAQMNEDTGNQTASAERKSSGEKIGLDEIIVLAVLIAITPYAIDITLQKRKIRKKEELYTEFLFKLSELMRGGLDPIKSVKELSKTDLGILTANVRIASTAMIYGRSFEDSMRTMAQSLHSELITRYTTLVVQASYSGGSVADLILKASEDMRSIISIEREKEGNLAQYVMIFYFAQGIIFFIIYTLSTSLLPYVTQLGASTIFGVNKIANLDFSRGFFHLIMINSFFGGLIIGKISEGEARFGLKHAVILMAAGYIACALLILPPQVAPQGPAINITPLSGDSFSGLVDLPLKDPIQFKLTDSSGNPVNSTMVQFSILPSGKVNPTSDSSDKNGIVVVNVVLGSKPGNYTLLAKQGENTGKVTIVAS